jgi:type 1 glutamine amidotransferase
MKTRQRIHLAVLIAALVLCAPDSLSAQAQETNRLLIFSKTAGFQHASIPAGIEAVRALGAAHQFEVETTEDAAAFTAEGLAEYDVVMFLSTTGDVLDESQQDAMEAFIQAGGGFVGVHAATDTEYDWPWYGKLVGAYFMTHPQVQEATLEVVLPSDPAVAHLPFRWTRTDEWYDFKALNPDVTVLLKIDPSSYEGSQMESDHPMAWRHSYDGGRAFYTANRQ